MRKRTIFGLIVILIICIQFLPVTQRPAVTVNAQEYSMYTLDLYRLIEGYYNLEYPGVVSYGSAHPGVQSGDVIVWGDMIDQFDDYSNNKEWWATLPMWLVGEKDAKMILVSFGNFSISVFQDLFDNYVKLYYPYLEYGVNYIITEYIPDKPYTASSQAPYSAREAAIAYFAANISHFRDAVHGRWINSYPAFSNIQSFNDVDYSYNTVSRTTDQDLFLRQFGFTYRYARVDYISTSRYEEIEAYYGDVEYNGEFVPAVTEYPKEIMLIVSSKYGDHFNKGRLRVYVKNVDGNYHEGVQVLLSGYLAQITGPKGFVEWSDLPNGDYSFQVYYKSPASLSLTEFWGSDSVIVSGPTPYLFTRNTQWISLDPTVNGIELGSETVDVGANVVIQVTVKNEESSMGSRNVKVRLILDRDFIEAYDYDETSSVKSINQGSIDSFNFSFTPTVEGVYQGYVVVYGEYSGNYLYTNQFNWTKAFTVEARAPIPPKATFNVSIEDQDGNPVVADNLILYNQYWEEITNVTPQTSAYIFNDIDADTYHIEAYADDMWIGHAMDIQLSMGQTVYRSITTHSRETLSISVYYSDGVTPFSGVIVKFYGFDDYSDKYNLQREEQVNNNGKLDLDNVWPTTKSAEHYHVYVYFDGTEVASKLNVQINQNTENRLNFITNTPFNGRRIASDELKLIPQETSMSCWAAASLMILDYYDTTPLPSQEDLAQMLGKGSYYHNGLEWTSIGDWEQNIESLGNIDVKPVEWYKGLSLSMIKEEIDALRPVIIFFDIGGLQLNSHWAVVVGYIDDSILVCDPSPSIVSNPQSPGNIYFLAWEYVDLVPKFLPGTHQGILTRPLLAEGTRVVLQETQDKLYLHVFDAYRQHVGRDHSTGQIILGIPGSTYYDFQNGTIEILLADNATDFEVTVDATFAEEETEPYTIYVSTIVESQTTNTIHQNHVIQQNMSESYFISIAQGTTKNISITSSETGLIWNMTPLFIGVGITVLASVLGVRWYSIRRKKKLNET